MPSQREIIPTTDEHGFARKHGEYLITKHQNTKTYETFNRYTERAAEEGY